jgi:tetratricopeptide (TPR) repeat protein
LAACTPHLKVPYWRPAEVNLRTIKEVAVGGVFVVGGDPYIASSFQTELIQAISDSGRYTVVDQAFTRDILAQVAYQNTGLVDASKAVEIGKLLGPKAMLFVNVPVYRWDESLDKSYWNDSDGKQHTKWTRKTWVNVDGAFQVIDCETGKILAIKNLKGYAEDLRSLDDRQPDSIDPKFLFDSARLAIIGDFMKVIAPFQEYADIYLYADKKLPQLEVGIRYAKVGTWEAAIKEFQGALAANPTSDKAMYDLGVAYEYTWQFDKALPLLDQAYATKPVGQYQRESSNCKRLWEERKKLEAQAPVN